MCRRRLLRRARIVSSLVGSVEVVVLLVLFIGAMLIEQPTTAFPVGESGDATTSAASGRSRRLHALPYQHTHIYQQRPTDATTQTPTSTWPLRPSSEDDYYTDDGAINEEMVNQKKDLYQQERENNDETINDNNPNELFAFANDQILSSSAAIDGIPFRQRSATNGFLACAMCTVVALWLLVW